MWQFITLFQATVFLIIVSINAVLWKKKRMERKGVSCIVLHNPHVLLGLPYRKHIGMYVLICIVNRQEKTVSDKTLH